MKTVHPDWTVLNGVWLMAKAIITKNGDIIPADDVYKFDACLERYIGRCLPPCGDCLIDRRTVCNKIKSFRFNNKPGDENERSGVHVLH